MDEKSKTRWVIFAGRPGRPGSRYVTLEGTVTRDKRLAAKFVTHGDAELFARSEKILLDGATRYVDHAEFDESDI